MARLGPTSAVLRALFARSGNQCAFPGCVHALINPSNDFIAQICHIESASDGGERYNLEQTDEDRRSYENLILLCYAHHVETNNVDEFTASALKQMKRNHEALSQKSNFKIDEAALHKIMAQMEIYWADIARLNSTQHSAPDFAFQIDAKRKFLELIEDYRETLAGLEFHHRIFSASDAALPQDLESLIRRKHLCPDLFSDVPYYENPFENRNWESHNIFVPNVMERLRIDLLHMEIKFLEEYLRTQSDDLGAHERLSSLKAQFAKIAQHSAAAD